MKFQKGDKVKLKNKGSKYSEIIFIIYDYVGKDSNLVYLQDKHGRVIIVSTEYLEYFCESLKYKFFTSTPVYDEESECFHGKLEGIKDLVTWEFNSWFSAEVEFKAAVDDYLEMKKAIRNEGKEEYAE